MTYKIGDKIRLLKKIQVDGVSKKVILVPGHSGRVMDYNTASVFVLFQFHDEQTSLGRTVEFPLDSSEIELWEKSDDFGG